MAVDLTERADAAVFLRRLLRLDPATLVRLCPAGPGRVALWASLPWGVLVTRTVAGSVDRDRVAAAAALLDGIADPPVLDDRWRGALPPATARAVERLPAAVIGDVAAAAAQALRDVGTTGLKGRAVGQRVLRDALLDHVVVSGTSDVDGVAFTVPQRLVQGLVRMGFLGAEDVTVVTAGTWTGLAGSFGTAWFRTPVLSVRPIASRSIG
ncbi:hypothetical protein [Catellatospora citrea]|uniref:Uncharacterized protein n=1 Tax=Catellatospora citrea TaxID=53366 RepID=A0A8J3KL84_9ACTN|nr:hypothetical protein [Catellatospora citrea]RKE07643.1 hypothetical protein C8E86_2476 [Catellatospora citrea]GIF99228.1 hypothetical protein Cci01nite_43220 [Catellatospora citrea]